MTDTTSEPEEPGPERRTSISIYASDLTWLKKQQLKISQQHGEWIPMFDLIHSMRTIVERIYNNEEGA